MCDGYQISSIVFIYLRNIPVLRMLLLVCRSKLVLVNQFILRVNPTVLWLFIRHGVLIKILQLQLLGILLGQLVSHKSRLQRHFKWKQALELGWMFLFSDGCPLSGLLEKTTQILIVLWKFIFRTSAVLSETSVHLFSQVVLALKKVTQDTVCLLVNIYLCYSYHGDLSDRNLRLKEFHSSWHRSSRI